MEEKVMDMKIKEKFTQLWKKYFNGAELPITFYYTDKEGSSEMVKPPGNGCLIGDLSKVRMGRSLCFSKESIGCGGGKRYCGFAEDVGINLEYFLSYGIPGKLEGERYKRSPELVRKAMKKAPKFKAPAKFIVFKRWDALDESDEPEVIIFFAPHDVLSGLFTLANFDEIDPDGVFAPFSSGCGSIILYPYLEGNSPRPRCILGMFDVSARPYVPKDSLSFAVPKSKFFRMIENMEESFLITSSWNKVYKRIVKREKK